MSKRKNVAFFALLLVLPWSTSHALDAHALWAQQEGPEGKSCADCHAPVEEAMQGRAATFPKFFAKAGREVTLEERINMCRKKQLKVEPWPQDSVEMQAVVEMLHSFD